MCENIPMGIQEEILDVRDEVIMLYRKMDKLCDFVGKHRRVEFLTPIDDLDLPSRTKSCLKRANIYYLEQVIRFNRNKLYLIRNMGLKSVQLIIDKARQFGLNNSEW